MTSFEFVFGLISVITSLALTQMLSGVVNLCRHAERVVFSWRHAFWVAIAIMLLIGNWARFWTLRDQHFWSVLNVLVPLIYVGALYAFCDLVMPERAEGHTLVNLRDYHVHEGKRYKLALLLFSAMILLFMALNAPDFTYWVRVSAFAMMGALICALALRARSVWLDTATAIAMMMLTSVYMIASLRVFSA